MTKDPGCLAVVASWIVGVIVAKTIGPAAAFWLASVGVVVCLLITLWKVGGEEGD